MRPSSKSQYYNIDLILFAASVASNVGFHQPKHQSSRESGFQSFNGSLSSIYSGLQLPSTVEPEMIELDRQSSTGSLLSLMSAQSALNMMAPPSVISRPQSSLYESGAGGSSCSNFTRLDQKRHSLTSLGRYQNPGSSASSISSRNSVIRRSAYIPRSNRRMMSSIIEYPSKLPVLPFQLRDLASLQVALSLF